MKSQARSTSGKKASSSRSRTRSSTPRVVVAGLRGGSGKTTLSIGLLGAFRRRGLAVAAFKKGPDYIDAGWLASASGGPCYNLDPYLIGKEKISRAFASRLADADIAIIEGNRGLFDGMDSKGSMSTAVVAREIKAPVVLIVDCTKATRTIAAILQGVESFERGLKIGGYVLNHVSGARHEAIIRESIKKYCRAPVLGAIPRLREMRMPERHMGLTPQQEHPAVEGAMAWAAGLVEKHVDVGAVLKVARSAGPLGAGRPAPSKPAVREKGGPRVGVIVDSAFQFYYPENLEALEERGATIVRISALTDRMLPDIDALYIGGGFPETHAIALAENSPFRRSLFEAASSGLPIYAECGGLMYLGESIEVEGKTYPMAAVLPISFELRKRPQAHGYTAVKVAKANPFFKVGVKLLGHEFHYSKVTRVGTGKGMYFAFKMLRGEGISGGMDGLVFKNILATYTHLHAIGSPGWADGMVAAARRFMKTSKG